MHDLGDRLRMIVMAHRRWLYSLNWMKFVNYFIIHHFLIYKWNYHDLTHFHYFGYRKHQMVHLLNFILPIETSNGYLPYLILPIETLKGFFTQFYPYNIGTGSQKPPLKMENQISKIDRHCWDSRIYNLWLSILTHWLTWSYVVYDNPSSYLFLTERPTFAGNTLKFHCYIVPRIRITNLAIDEEPEITPEPCEYR